MNNEHCILSILAHLPLEDLANVALSSHFFKKSALATFEKLHSATIEIEYDPDNFDQKQMIFRQFGSLATKIIVSSRNYTDEEETMFDQIGCEILATISHFCGSNLKDLTLGGMLIDISPKSIGFFAENQMEVRKLIGTLSNVSLVNVCVKSRFFQYLRSLEELVIHSCCHMEDLPQITTLPQLKTLRIGACPHWPLVPGDEFNEFLRANPSIEKIDYNFIVLNDGHLESICALPNLTELEVYLIHSNANEIALLSKMKKIKKLKLYIDPMRRNQFSKLREMLPSDVHLSIKDIMFNIHHNH